MKKLCSALLLLTFTFAAISADPFNNKLTAADREDISGGDILIKNTIINNNITSIITTNEYCSTLTSHNMMSHWFIVK